MTAIELGDRPARRLVAPPAAVSSLPFVAVRDEFIAICEGDLCAAAILSAFETWAVGKLDHLHQDAEGNPTWTPEHAAEVWIYKTQPEMKDDLKGLFGLSKVVTTFKKLRVWGFLSSRQNPAQRQDRTLQYRFEVTVVQGRLSNPTAQALSSNSPGTQIQQTRLSKSTDGAVKNNSSTVEPEGLAPSETTAGTLNFNRTIPKTLNTDSSETLPEILGEEDARTREQPSSPVLHPIIQAFLSSHPDGIRPVVAGDWHELACELVDALGAQPDEITALMRDKWADRKRTFYRFEWLRNDLVEWRGKQLRLVGREDAAPAPVDDAQYWRDFAATNNAAADQWAATREAEQTQLSGEAGVPVLFPAPDMPGESLSAWQGTCLQLQHQWGPADYHNLLDNAYLVRLEGADTFVVAVRNAAARDTLKYRMFKTVNKTLSAVLGREAQVEYLVGQPPAGGDVRRVGEAQWMRDLRSKRGEPV